MRNELAVNGPIAYKSPPHRVLIWQRNSGLPECRIMTHRSQRAASLALLTTLSVLAAIVVASLAGVDHTAGAAEVVEPVVITPAGSNRPITLRDRLVSGLRARLKSEIAFVDGVALAVKQGQVPQRLVDETFFWSRIRAADPRYGRPRRPIVYFQPAMAARAKRLGVKL